MVSQTMTVAEALSAALRRRRAGADIDTLHEQATKLTGRRISRATVSTQLLRHRDRFKRVGRGTYAARPKRAA